MTELAAHGVSVTLPVRWEGRVTRRPEAGEAPPDDVALSRLTPDEAASSSVEARPTSETPAPAGETTNAVAHVATVALPPGTSDFASDSVDRLGPTDALIVLFEYDREAASEPLFARAGIPRDLQPTDFSPSVLQRSLRGQAGAQFFFHEVGRAFCLYVVLGSYGARATVVPEVNQVLATFAIDGGSPAPVRGTALDAIQANADWSTFASLLTSSGAASTVAGATAVTVFAPRNALIAEGEVTALRSDPDLLRRTMLQHIVPESLPLGVLQGRVFVSTQAGGRLAVSLGGVLTVGGRTVSAPVEVVDGFVYSTDGLFAAPR